MSLTDLEPVPLRAASLTIRLIALAVVVAVIAFVLWWVLIRPVSAQKEAAAAKVEARGAENIAVAAKDATTTGDRVQVLHDRIERITHENTTRILAAPGAAAPVPAAVGDAWLRAICLRNAHQRDPACAGLHDAAAQVGDGADAGGSPPG